MPTCSLRSVVLGTAFAVVFGLSGAVQFQLTLEKIGILGPTRGADGTVLQERGVFIILSMLLVPCTANAIMLIDYAERCAQNAGGVNVVVHPTDARSDEIAI